MNNKTYNKIKKGEYNITPNKHLRKKIDRFIDKDLEYDYKYIRNQSSEVEHSLIKKKGAGSNPADSIGDKSNIV